MGTQLAEMELADPRVSPEGIGFARVAYRADAPADNQRNTAPRGIVIAVLISTPFWALIAFLVYVLI